MSTPCLAIRLMRVHQVATFDDGATLVRNARGTCRSIAKIAPASDYMTNQNRSQPWFGETAMHQRILARTPLSLGRIN